MLKEKTREAIKTATVTSQNESAKTPAKHTPLSSILGLGFLSTLVYLGHQLLSETNPDIVNSGPGAQDLLDVYKDLLEQGAFEYLFDTEYKKTIKIINDQIYLFAVGKIQDPNTIQDSHFICYHLEEIIAEYSTYKSDSGEWFLLNSVCMYDIYEEDDGEELEDCPLSEQVHHEVDFFFTKEDLDSPWLAEVIKEEMESTGADLDLFTEAKKWLKSL